MEENFQDERQTYSRLVWRCVFGWRFFGFCCFWVGGLFVEGACGVCCLGFLLGLEDDQGALCGSSSLSSSSSLWHEEAIWFGGDEASRSNVGKNLAKPNRNPYKQKQLNKYVSSKI
jgi:hypothetical protein